MGAPYVIDYNAGKLQAFVSRLRMEGDTPARLGDLVRQVGLLAQARAVYNVSGYPVTYEGGTFRVRVQTGALKGSINLQYPYADLFSARVYVNGAMTATTGLGGGQFSKPRPVSEYAGAIEWGHKQIDLKRTMQGKIVPFFGARAQKARGPYAAVGLMKVEDGPHQGQYASIAHAERLAATGKRPMYFTRMPVKGAGAYFISFRRVGKTGWVIPKAAPRPFMRSAGEAIVDQGRRLITNGVATILRDI